MSENGAWIKLLSMDSFKLDDMVFTPFRVQVDQTSPAIITYGTASLVSKYLSTGSLKDWRHQMYGQILEESEREDSQMTTRQFVRYSHLKTDKCYQTYLLSES